jgi:hypothetical protein
MTNNMKKNNHNTTASGFQRNQIELGKALLLLHLQRRGQPKKLGGRNTTDRCSNRSFSCPRSLEDKIESIVEIARKQNVGDNPSQVIVNCLIEFYERNKFSLGNNSQQTNNPLNLQYCNNNNALTASSASASQKEHPQTVVKQQITISKSTSQMIDLLNETVYGYMTDNQNTISSDDLTKIQESLIQLKKFASEKYFEARTRETLQRRPL